VACRKEVGVEAITPEMVAAPACWCWKPRPVATSLGDSPARRHGSDAGGRLL